MSLLYLVAEFVTNCASRAKELKDIIRKKVPFPDVIIERTQAAVRKRDLVSVWFSLVSSNIRNLFACLDFRLQISDFVFPSIA